ncbi:MAG TPA: hypothetical protein PLC39_03720 [Methanomassiliicoccales archaeon]|nr:hypothetical protein [Methanomassiliicoccales archaeon]HPR98388.1 hypothetical protein [Methanomassiliicoccales archaeon]
MTTLNAVLKEILETRGFLVDQVGPFVRGRRDNIELHFFPYVRHSPAAMEELVKTAPVTKGKVVLAALVPLAESTLAALPPGLVVWDREAVEHEIGRTRIEKLVGEEDHGLIDDLYADDVPMLDDDHSGVGEERILPMRISLQEVVELTSKTVGGYSQRLELVPHYVFAYQVPLFVGEGKVGGREGNMAVNALTKGVQPWDQVPETVTNLDQGYKRLEPVLEEEDATALVRTTVEREHTYDRDMIRENGQVTMTERVTVHPRLDLGSVRPLGIYYVPIWCVEGTKGVMIIDASNGKVLSEDYFRDIS